MAAPLALAHGTLVCRGTPVGNHCLKVLTDLSELGECDVSEDPVEDGEDEDRDGDHEVAGVDGASGHINLKSKLHSFRLLL